MSSSSNGTQKGSTKNNSKKTGDPWMNRAVQAKLDDPDMPLITALLIEDVLCSLG
jgi:hypothetical protein